jgi:lipopolysaccharide export system permease protein
VKKIFKLTTFSFLGPFIAIFFVVLFTLLMQFLWLYIDDLIGKGLEWYTLMELLFYASASFVPLSLPLAVLLSSIMAFGKLSETYELTALKSAGISLLRIMVPMIITIFLFFIFAVVFANNIMPRANLKFRSLLWDITQKRPAFNIKEGVFYSGIDNYSIRIQKKGHGNTSIEGITIYDHSGNSSLGNEVVITAEKGEMSTTKDHHWLVLKLVNGTRYEEHDNTNNKITYPFSRLHFDTYLMKLDLSGFKLSRTNEDLFKDQYQMLNLKQLEFYRDSVQRAVTERRSKVVDYTKPYIRLLRDTAYFFHHDFPVNAEAAKAPFIENFPQEDRREIADRALNLARTLREIMRVQQDEISTYEMLDRKYLIEWHRKFALSFACITLFFIGAPLGAIIRKGGLGMPTIVSIIMFIIFYVIYIAGEKSAKEGAIPVWLGMWLPNIVLLPIGFYLTWRANVDAISFSADRIKRIFRSISQKFRPKRRAYSDPV